MYHKKFCINIISGFITGLVHDWDARRCCEFASATGAICVGEVGPNDAVKSFEMVLDFLKGKKNCENCSNY